MFEKFLEALQSIAASLKDIAISLKGAAVQGRPAGTAAPAAATAPAAPTAPAAAPAAATTTAAAEIPGAPAAPAPGAAAEIPGAAASGAISDEDLFGAPDKKLTQDDVLAAAKKASGTHGREFVKGICNSLAAANVKELKESQFQQFLDLVNAGPKK